MDFRATEVENYLRPASQTENNNKIYFFEMKW